MSCSQMTYSWLVYIKCTRYQDRHLIHTAKNYHLVVYPQLLLAAIESKTFIFIKDKAGDVWFVNKSDEKIKTSNELMLLTSVVCVAETWCSLHLCAVELHFHISKTHQWSTLLGSLPSTYTPQFILTQSHKHRPAPGYTHQRKSSPQQIHCSPEFELHFFKTTVLSCFRKIKFAFIKIKLYVWPDYKA